MARGMQAGVGDAPFNSDHAVRSVAGSKIALYKMPDVLHVARLIQTYFFNGKLHTFLRYGTRIPVLPAAARIEACLVEHDCDASIFGGAHRYNLCVAGCDVKIIHIYKTCGHTNS